MNEIQKSKKIVCLLLPVMILAMTLCILPSSAYSYSRAFISNVRVSPSGWTSGAVTVSGEINGIADELWYEKEGGSPVHVSDFEPYSKNFSFTLPADDYSGGYTIYCIDTDMHMTSTAVAFTVHQDKTAPAAEGITDGGTYYGDQEITIDELNPDTVTVDSAEKTLTDSKLTIKADGKTHDIVITDLAGNTVSYSITVKFPPAASTAAAAKDSTPDTGDISGVMPWILLMILSLAVFALIRRKNM